MSGLKATVAEHYNNLVERGLEMRRESPIYYLRNFNNFIKSVSISEALRSLRFRRPGARLRALDLCCGKGGDMNKWSIGQLDKVVFADIAEVSVNQAKDRYREMCDRQRRYDRLYSAEFIVADCAEVNLADRYADPSQMFDLVSCQFSFHYSFETYERAERMLKNACDRLSPGGIFVATVPDAHEIMKRLKATEGNQFGNDIYSVGFETKEQQPLFGAKYHFYLQEHVDCPEFLVFFPVLLEMAGKLGMRIMYRSTFNEFFEEHSSNRSHVQLLERMIGLETYPSDSLVGSQDDYDYAQYVIDHRLPRDADPSPRVGTLSKPEWQVTSMYSVFAFQKMEENTASRNSESERNKSDKRRSRSASQEDFSRNPKGQRRQQTDDAEDK